MAEQGLPVTLDVAGKLAVVVGAGPVGRRKRTSLLAAGATVRVVALETADCEGVEWRMEPYRAAHLAGASLVVAAATVAVNRCVVADARASGVWVNCAAPGELGDVRFPAVLRANGVMVAVSTEGAGPAAARAVRDELAAAFDDAFAAWLELMERYRRQVQLRVSDESRRRTLMREAARPIWRRRIRRLGADVVWERWMMRVNASE